MHIQRFADYCKSQQMSDHTIRTYVTSLRQFGNDIDTNPQSVSRANVRNFVASLSDSGLSPATIRTRIAALSSFFDWALMEEIVQINPVSAVKTPKVSAKLPDFIPRAELMRIIDSVDGDDLQSLRDRAILELGYAGAMRVSDLERANLEDVDIGRMRIKITGKGNKQAYIQFGEGARDALKKYIDRRESDGIGNREKALFVNMVNGERMATIARRVRTITGKSPHTAFRRSGATHFAMDGADIRSVQGHLRHSSLTTTARYVGLDDARFRDQYFAHYPRARKNNALSR